MSNSPHASGNSPPDPPESPSGSAAEIWRNLLEASESGLRAYLAAKLPQPADVEDCFQAVCVAALEKIQDVPPAARKAWLFRVAANQAALYWRKNATARKALENVSGAVSESQANYQVESLEHRETVQRVNDAIEQLPKEMRDVVRMRIHDDLTFQAIADKRNLPLGTVLTRMRRAMDRLRNQLENND